MNDLNLKQKEAAEHKDGPLLIIAGAGAGKTKTITERIVNLIKSGVAPHEILAITFTNKAAREMKDRVMFAIKRDSLMNFPISQDAQGVNYPFMSTFHSLGVHVIKENARSLDLTRHFAIFDRTDSKRSIKEALESANLDPKRFEPGKILNVISRHKGDFVNLHEYTEHSGGDYFAKVVARVWYEYEKILRREKALDFDDLLLKTAELLKNNLEVRAHYQNIWKYIHIDEYQDTNEVQYAIAKYLAEKNRNLCVVGDSDQMIYSWRGANIHNILHFEKDYPEAKVVLLEQNYRSTKNILAIANAIIEKNTVRKKKKLFTEKEDGEKIGLYSAFDEVDEAYFITERAKNLISNGVTPREIAVLYRANFQSRIIEEACLALDVPYQVLGTRFFERKEIKDVLSYIRASLNPDSHSDIKRIINVPPRGIGKVGLLKIFAKESLPLKQQIQYNHLQESLKKIAEKCASLKASDLVRYVISEIKINEFLDDGTEEGQERIANVKELVTVAQKYDNFQPEEGIEKLLSDAALATDQDSLEKNENSIKLMTVHAAKGLEFDYVFIGGLEENLFPHMPTDLSELTLDESEEERRLFYVALTRAKRKLILSYAQTRTLFGSKQSNLPSSFLSEIDSNLLEEDTRDAIINF